MKSKIILISTLFNVGLYATSMPPMPPMVPSLDTKKVVKKGDTKKTMPDSCKLIPPMVIFLPPPMEAELSKCKNELHKPNKTLVTKQLSKLLKKSVKVTKVEVVKKFNQLYKVTYDKNKTILINKNADAFIEQ